MFPKFPVLHVVTIDYKALLLLLKKKDDEDFKVGGKGYDVEFCVFYDAIRVLMFVYFLLTCNIINQSAVSQKYWNASAKK